MVFMIILVRFFEGKMFIWVSGFLFFFLGFIDVEVGGDYVFCDFKEKYRNRKRG